MNTRQRIWQLKRLADGKCIICGKARGPNGTKTHCRRHADQANATKRRRNQRNNATATVSTN